MSKIPDPLAANGQEENSGAGDRFVQFEYRPLRAEIIAIGDEILSGARVDTNSQWLSRRLAELGVEVKYHTAVGDTLEDNVTAFRTAADRADIVVSTGGLGPTRDDLTREALAAMSGQPLVENPQAMQHIESMFAKRKRTMPERNRVQAMFPEGSDQVFNPQGTAPGIDFIVPQEHKQANQDADHPTARIFALPGVPAEMKRMFDETLAPGITQMHAAESSIEHHVMKFFGTGESDMEQRLGNMIDRRHNPRVGITASSATLSLRISARAASKATCQEMIDRTREQILDRVGEFYFGDGETFEQQHAVADQLEQRNESLGVIELGRAAPLADWFAALDPTSAYVGGISAVNSHQLATLLGCDPQCVFDSFKRNSQADWLVIVDSYPSLETNDERPLPAAEVCFTTICPQGIANQIRLTLGGHPSILQARIGKTALMVLRKRITGTPG